MGKLTTFDIVFGNFSGVFYSGNVIQGHINIELSESMKMRGIKLTFEGKAKVHWTEQEQRGTGDDRHTETVHYKSSEKYFDKDIILYGVKSSDGSSTSELQAGVHAFPFEFHLPPGLPSSFEGGIGHIRYLVKCKIDKPWKFDHKVKRPFTVISVLDLNSQPSYRNRVQDEKQKHLCCLCCQSGPITAVFHIDRQGYVPGEAIKLYAEISNATSRKMDKSYVNLTMIIAYHARGKTKKRKTEIAKISRPAIEGHSDDSWTGEQLILPPLPPSYLVGCNIIDITYILQLNVDPSGPGLDLEIPLEIVIGTIPLAYIVEQHPPMPPALPSGYMGFWPNPSAPPDEIELYPQAPANAVIPNLPPPSYAECVTGKTNIKDDSSDDDNEYTRGNLNYAPAYTYYNWGNTPQPLPPQS